MSAHLSRFTASAGRVTLAGAGPGDPELITLKLAHRLAEADVILIDRLVNPEIVKALAKPEALCVYVGKKGYSDESISQQTINDLLVLHALSGKQVVRLKGGDVAFFSNVLDELRTLTAHHIPFEIIPGITAASGASAYSGVPLTARGAAKAVRFLSFEDNATLTEAQWTDLASTTDTLVFYMGARNISRLMMHFQQFASTSKSVMVVERATTPEQRIFTGSTHASVFEWLPEDVQTPALIIVGEVVRFQSEFDWFTPEHGNATEHPLTTTLAG